ncbi:hypothetical protein ACIQU5_28045 [Streptomyces sp. NPDC090306]|uniref:hypothetical protein n=1 Tax=Streptomyces sp. NPDC090306 TaxID=3365961 RepID=UPI00382B093E
MMIDNTADYDETRALLFLAAAMGPGGTDRAIEEQEHQGQIQVVNSERLPTDLGPDSRAAYEALGIRFGEPADGDPLFQHVTLPDGWTRQPGESDLWSYVVDELGRRRVTVFYKAAFYDRRAWMRLATVSSYIADCVRSGTDVVTDDLWATPEDVADAARAMAEAHTRSLENGAGDRPDWLIQERAAYQRIAAQLPMGGRA